MSACLRSVCPPFKLGTRRPEIVVPPILGPQSHQSRPRSPGSSCTSVPRSWTDPLVGRAGCAALWACMSTARGPVFGGRRGHLGVDLLCSSATWPPGRPPSRLLRSKSSPPSAWGPRCDGHDHRARHSLRRCTSGKCRATCRLNMKSPSVRRLPNSSPRAALTWLSGVLLSRL
jgi:hypothetical protein